MAELLTAREVRGLRILVITRQVVLTLFVGGTFIAPNSTWEAWVAGAILFGSLPPNYWLYRQLERPERAGLVGTLGAVFDVGLLVLIPLIWYRSVGWTAVEPAYLLKANMPNLAAVFVAANAIALRPRYPLVVTIGGAAIMLGYLPFVLADPRTRFTEDYADVMLGSEVNLLFFVMSKVGMLLLTGVVVSAATLIARRTVYEAAELERSNAEMRAERDQVVLQEKLASISSVVAGIAHEVNNPVGVIQSSAGTLQRCVDKLEAPPGEDGKPPRMDRVLGVMRDTVKTTAEAGARIGKVVHTLESFSKMDSGAQADVDLHTSLQEAIAVTAFLRPDGFAATWGLAEATPTVRGQPRELAELLRILVSTASEGLLADGNLWVESKVTEDAVTVEIARDGPASEAAGASVDVRFEAGGARVRANLDLPLAHAIAAHHGGSLELTSGEDRALRCVLELPTARGEA